MKWISGVLLGLLLLTGMGGCDTIDWPRTVEAWQKSLCRAHDNVDCR